MAVAVAAGGTDEGQPGFREIYSLHFYVGYLSDPQRIRTLYRVPDDGKLRKSFLRTMILGLIESSAGAPFFPVE